MMPPGMQSAKTRTLEIQKTQQVNGKGKINRKKELLLKSHIVLCKHIKRHTKQCGLGWSLIQIIPNVKDIYDAITGI